MAGSSSDKINVYFTLQWWQAGGANHNVAYDIFPYDGYPKRCVANFKINAACAYNTLEDAELREAAKLRFYFPVLLHCLVASFSQEHITKNALAKDHRTLRIDRVYVLMVENVKYVSLRILKAVSGDNATYHDFFFPFVLYEQVLATWLVSLRSVSEWYEPACFIVVTNGGALLPEKGIVLPPSLKVSVSRYVQFFHDEKDELSSRNYELTNYIEPMSNLWISFDAYFKRITEAAFKKLQGLLNDDGRTALDCYRYYRCYIMRQYHYEPADEDDYNMHEYAQNRYSGWSEHFESLRKVDGRYPPLFNLLNRLLWYCDLPDVQISLFESVKTFVTTGSDDSDMDVRVRQVAELLLALDNLFYGHVERGEQRSPFSYKDFLMVLHRVTNEILSDVKGRNPKSPRGLVGIVVKGRRPALTSSLYEHVLKPLLQELGVDVKAKGKRADLDGEDLSHIVRRRDKQRAINSNAQWSSVVTWLLKAKKALYEQNYAIMSAVQDNLLIERGDLFHELYTYHEKLSAVQLLVVNFENDLVAFCRQKLDIESPSVELSKFYEQCIGAMTDLHGKVAKLKQDLMLVNRLCLTVLSFFDYVAPACTYVCSDGAKIHELKRIPIFNAMWSVYEPVFELLRSLSSCSRRVAYSRGSIDAVIKASNLLELCRAYFLGRRTIQEEVNSPRRQTEERRDVSVVQRLQEGLAGDSRFKRFSTEQRKRNLEMLRDTLFSDYPMLNYDYFAKQLLHDEIDDVSKLFDKAKLVQLLGEYFKDRNELRKKSLFDQRENIYWRLFLYCSDALLLNKHIDFVGLINNLWTMRAIPDLAKMLRVSNGRSGLSVQNYLSAATASLCDREGACKWILTEVNPQALRAFSDWLLLQEGMGGIVVNGEIVNPFYDRLRGVIEQYIRQAMEQYRYQVCNLGGFRGEVNAIFDFKLLGQLFSKEQLDDFRQYFSEKAWREKAFFGSLSNADSLEVMRTGSFFHYEEPMVRRYQLDQEGLPVAVAACANQMANLLRQMLDRKTVRAQYFPYLQALSASSFVGEFIECKSGGLSDENWGKMNITEPLRSLGKAYLRDLLHDKMYADLTVVLRSEQGCLLELFDIKFCSCDAIKESVKEHFYLARLNGDTDSRLQRLLFSSCQELVQLLRLVMGEALCNRYLADMGDAGEDDVACIDYPNGPS